MELGDNIVFASFSLQHRLCGISEEKMGLR